MPNIAVAWSIFHQTLFINHIQLQPFKTVFKPYNSVNPYSITSIFQRPPTERFKYRLIGTDAE